MSLCAEETVSLRNLIPAWPLPWEILENPAGAESHQAAFACAPKLWLLFLGQSHCQEPTKSPNGCFPVERVMLCFYQLLSRKGIAHTVGSVSFGRKLRCGHKVTDIIVSSSSRTQLPAPFLREHTGYWRVGRPSHQSVSWDPRDKTESAPRPPPPRSSLSFACLFLGWWSGEGTPDISSMGR